MLQILQVTATAQRLFVALEISLADEMHRNTKEGTVDFILPSGDELDPSDFSQNVDAHGSNSNLIDGLVSDEGCSSDSIMLKLRTAKAAKEE